MKKKILIYLSITISVFLFTSLILADNELTIFCGGDNQTAVGCLGDSQTYSAGFSAPMPISTTQNVTNITNVTNQTIIIVQGGGGAPSGGGGFPSVTTTPSVNFALSPTNIKEFLKQGEIITDNITVTNQMGSAITISISNPQLGDLIRLSDTSVTLNPGESRVIKVDLIARDDTNPDLYLGPINFESGGTTKQVFVALEVESKNPLLDVALNLPVQYQQASPNENILLGVTLYNLGSSFGDVSMEYIVRNVNGTQILDQTDTVAIQTQTSFIKNIQIPSDAPLGDYEIYVKATYNGKIASASTELQITSVSAKEKIYIIIIIGLSVIISGLIGYIIIRRLKRKYKRIKRANMEDLLWR